MKIFTNKRIWKKIVIALLLVLAFQTVMVKPVQADVVEFGGKLISPILSLLVGLGDGINDIIARSIMGANTTLYRIETGSSFWEGFLTIIIAIAAAAITIGLVVATGGLAVVAAAAVGITATVSIGAGTIIAGLGAGLLSAVWFNDQVLPEDIYLPMYTYSAEEIFKGNILLFDVNFFDDGKEIYAHLSDGADLKVSDYPSDAELQEEVKSHIIGGYGGTTGYAEDKQGGKSAKIEYYYFLDEGKEVKTSSQNSAVMLRKTISQWYNALRNICIVLMLSVLVYIGIRILLSTVASDKAKYLEMLKDWLIGLCLLFLMHYIMAFSVAMVEMLTDIVKTSVDENGYAVVIEADDDIKTAIQELGLTGDDDPIQTVGGIDYLTWPTNLMGSLRLQLQMEQYGAEYIGLSICFLILCLFTLYFTITYLRRLLHLAFLTLIAPMVALTYCIDKINDGKAQGFDKWFKEYIFNLLIQPMHLLLYYILVTSAFEFASTNVIYSIAAIGFMIPAEKLLRSLFGFEKAQTAPAMGPAGAMMASTALNHMLNRGKKGGDKSGSGKDGAADGGSESAPNPRESGNPMANFMEDEKEGQKQMLDSYDEQHGTQDWDPAERDAIAREAYADDNKGMNYSNEDYENIVRDTLGEGASDEEVQDFLRENYGIDPLPLQQEEGQPEEQSEEQPEEPKKQSKMRKMANRVRSGMNSSPVGRRIIRSYDASKAAQLAAIRSTPQRLKEKIEKSHPMKAVGKVATGAALGAAAGATGVAIAASTGDLSNVPKIGGAAVATGYAVGAGKAQSIKSPMDDSEVKAVYDNTYNKGEYKQDAMDDYVSNYMKDVKNRNYFETKFGKEEAKKMMEKGGAIEQFLYNDITNKKDIAAAYKMQQKGEVRNMQEAIAIAQLSQMVGDNTNNMTEKKRNEWRTRFGSMAKESGVKNTQAFAERRLRELDKFHDFKK